MGTPMGDRHEIAKLADTAHERAGRRSCGAVRTVGAWMLAAAAIIGSVGATSIDHDMNKREKEIAGANGGESVNTVTVTGKQLGHGSAQRHQGSADKRRGADRDLAAFAALDGDRALPEAGHPRPAGPRTWRPGYRFRGRVCTIRPVRPLRA